MLFTLAFPGLGMTATRSATAGFSIPVILDLSLPGHGLSGKAVVLELRSEALAQGFPLSLGVKSNVPWAVTARVLAEPGAVFSVATVDGPEVAVGAEEVLLLSGRPGKHEVRVLIQPSFVTSCLRAKLVLKVLGL